MSIFKKKKVEIQEKPQECAHKWKDFHWYLDAQYYKAQGGRRYMYNYTIYEPYVCIYCHKRENVVLEEQRFSDCHFDWILKDIERIKTTFSELRERAEVENEINDYIKVDRDYLKIMDMLKNPGFLKKENE